MRISTSLLGASAVALIISCTQAQEAPVTVPPPKTGDNATLIYTNDGNGVIASETALFNVCYSSEQAFAKYSYLNIAPNNATINFYTDSSCQVFTFGLDGYYGGYPGPARSYKWVGWSMDSLGELFNKEPIQGQGDAATGGNNPGTPPGGKNPGNTTPVPPPTTQPETMDEDVKTTPVDTPKTSSSSTFFGGVVGSLIVLSVGGVIFWKTAGKRLVADKGKGVLPYNRVGRDGDILLTNNSRSHNSFEIGDEDDEEDEVEPRRQAGSGRQGRYRDDEA
ncbi:hypothetical protein BGX21_006006 [Mortierella sp. AD011]|nr:hypothetical protein BGX20_004873 [Mortierella sp. AD010]KAF9369339.1 hypothetical protein BGX21_006006 [Mortierella sp. AD011]